jgi:hypothetical protein
MAADVGVSIQFSQPGLFGRVDVGQYPQPQVIVPEPVMIERPPRALPCRNLSTYGCRTNIELGKSTAANTTPVDDRCTSLIMIGTRITCWPASQDPRGVAMRSATGSMVALTRSTDATREIKKRTGAEAATNALRP